MWPWRVKMPTHNLMRLLLVLMLMLRNVLMTVWCRSGSWSLAILGSFWGHFKIIWCQFVAQKSNLSQTSQVPTQIDHKKSRIQMKMVVGPTPKTFRSFRGPRMAPNVPNMTPKLPKKSPKWPQCLQSDFLNQPHQNSAPLAVVLSSHMTSLRQFWV